MLTLAHELKMTAASMCAQMPLREFYDWAAWFHARRQAEQQPAGAHAAGAAAAGVPLRMPPIKGANLAAAGAAPAARPTAGAFDLTTREGQQALVSAFRADDDD